jgi:hypothetical protein
MLKKVRFSLSKILTHVLGTFFRFSSFPSPKTPFDFPQTPFGFFQTPFEISQTPFEILRTPFEDAKTALFYP